MKSAEELQQRLYYLLEQLQEMARQLPLQYQQRIPYELLSGLANCLLNETIFKIVEGLTEIQQVTEKQLLQQRLKLLHKQRAEKETLAKKLPAPAVPGLDSSNELEMTELLTSQKTELKQADMNLISQLDQLVLDQQTALEKAGVPGFYISSNPQEIRVQIIKLTTQELLSFSFSNVWLTVGYLSVTSNTIDMWVFGYGSLVWKVDFPVKQRIVGYIKGYVRRFWQASIDHRGVPGKPGRVVTLIPSNDPEERVWGVAYEIRKEDVDSVCRHLDYREKDGYQRQRVTFYHPHADNGVEEVSSLELEFYLATETNEFYCGEESNESIARLIVTSSGPSGTNREYLYRLAAAVRNLGPLIDDHHLFDLENRVRYLEAQQQDDSILE